MDKLSLHAIRSATKITQMRRDINYNPHKYRAILLVVSRLPPPNHLPPTI
jgi:hypothetical protein